MSAISHRRLHFRSLPTFCGILLTGAAKAIDKNRVRPIIIFFLPSVKDGPWQGVASPAFHRSSIGGLILFIILKVYACKPALLPISYLFFVSITLWGVAAACDGKKLEVTFSPLYFFLHAFAEKFDSLVAYASLGIRACFLGV